jgi:hypothetical protein
MVSPAIDKLSVFITRLWDRLTTWPLQLEMFLDDPAEQTA